MFARFGTTIILLLVTALQKQSAFTNAQDNDDEPTVPEYENPLEALQETPSLSTLDAAATQVGLGADLENVSLTRTYFAPTDAAFDTAISALNITREELLSNRSRLGTLLSYHIAHGAFTAAAFTNNTELKLVYRNSGFITASADEGVTELKLPDSTSKVNVTFNATDIFAGQSVVHLVDSVILPSSNTNV